MKTKMAWQLMLVKKIKRLPDALTDARRTALCVAMLLFIQSLKHTRKFKKRVIDKRCQISFNLECELPPRHTRPQRQHDLLPTTIAHDNGKPVVRQGRKAVSLWQLSFTLRDDCLVTEGRRK
jgi:hypothetical protein